MQIQLSGGTLNLLTSQLSDYAITFQGSVGSSGANVVMPAGANGQWNVVNNSGGPISIGYAGQATPVALSNGATQVLYCNTKTVSILSPNVSAASGVLPITSGGTGSNSRFSALAALSAASTKRQQGYTAATTTLSNIGGATSAITNSNYYPFMNAIASAGGVIDTTHFNYPAGKPVPFQWWYAGICGLTPQSQSDVGKIVVETVANTKQLELKYRNTGAGTLDVVIDGVKVFDAVDSPSAIGTAQAGAASTITLAAGSNTTNGFYNQQYVYINGGTGIGQRKRITGYVGATKVATVDSAWTTNPDAASTYIVSPSPYTIAGGASGNEYYVTITFSGEVRPHFVRIVSNSVLLGIGVDSSGTLSKPQVSAKMKLLNLGDSYASGLVGATGQSECYGALLAKNLGLEYENLGVGGTGVVADSGAVNLNYSDRTVPPLNSWMLNLGAPSGGTFTLSQGGTTTAAIAYNTSISTLQAALDAAFGAGRFKTRIPCFSGGNNFLIMGLGTNTANAAPMTIGIASLTSTVPATLKNYTGDIDPVLPVDSAGNNLPFILMIQGSGNDTAVSSQLSGAINTLLPLLTAKYPQAIIIVMGMWMNGGPFSGTALTMQQTLKTAATNLLPTINGKVAFLQTFAPENGNGYLVGSTNVTAPSGAAGVNTDLNVGNDGQHPSSFGHFLLGDFTTYLMDNLLYAA